MYVLGYVRCGPPSFSCIFGFTNPCYEERNTPYITSLLFVVIMTACLGAATINRFPEFIVVRLLRGQSEDRCSLSTGGASATDLFSMVKAAYAVSAWSASDFAGPGLGPMIAAFALAESTWR